MCAVLGYEVKRLKRVRIMNVKLKGIEVGKWRNLTKKEILDINNMITDSSKTEEASKLKNE
jgi:23S rRNA pseudouridine2604 synthase